MKYCRKSLEEWNYKREDDGETTFRFLDREYPSKVWTQCLYS